DPVQIRDPFNLFQNSPTSAAGALSLTEPVSKAGDHIIFRALVNLVGAVSSCAQDFLPVNGFRITELRILVTGDRPC
ncbi:MAG TPA: DUF1989 domain-containing protein, partial [Methylomirabilota bacterium]|nr:DUF1989 domain-containing protein [Methylomirabilota bacterium]